MRFVVPILMLFAATSFAAEPTQYPTVVEAIESANEYSLAEGDLVLVSEDPLHVTVKPSAFPGDLAEVLEETAKREIVWTALLAFAHTSVPELTITAAPEEMNFQTKKKRPLKAYERTVEVTRERFNSLVKKYLKLDSAADLIGDQKIGNEVLPDMPLDASNRILYNDQGHPGLDRFFAELVK